MDYLIEVGKNKYKTNFFIPDGKYQLTNRKFHFERTLPIAEQLYKIIENALPEIKKIGFNQGGFSDHYLIWQMIPLLIFKTIQNVDDEMIESKGLQHSAPKRKDGTKHWACASLRMIDILDNSTDISEELRNFCVQEKGNAIKLLTTDTIQGLQFDLGFMSGNRDFNITELKQLKRVNEIIAKKEIPNSYDKEIIANLIRLGYVSRHDGTLNILIPYFSSSQMKKVNEILERYSEELIDKEVIRKIFSDYISTMDNEIPDYVNTNERNHLLTGYSPFITILWFLYQNNSLKKPTEDEIKCICTIAYEI